MLAHAPPADGVRRHHARSANAPYIFGGRRRRRDLRRRAGAAHHLTGARVDRPALAIGRRRAAAASEALLERPVAANPFCGGRRGPRPLARNPVLPPRAAPQALSLNGLCPRSSKCTGRLPRPCRRPCPRAVSVPVRASPARACRPPPRCACRRRTARGAPSLGAIARPATLTSAKGTASILARGSGRRRGLLRRRPHADNPAPGRAPRRL